MRRKFTTYIEEESIAWLKQEALNQEIATGSRVSAADIINNLIEKERVMEKEKNIVLDIIEEDIETLKRLIAESEKTIAAGDWVDSKEARERDREKFCFTAGVLESIRECVEKGKTRGQMIDEELAEDWDAE